MSDSDTKAALDIEWYEDGKVRRIRIGRIVLMFLILVVCSLRRDWSIGIWQMLEKLFK